MVGSQTRSDFTRDPCPWRIVEDMGSAYSLGLAGGAIWQGGKSVIKVSLFFYFIILICFIARIPKSTKNDPSKCS